VDSAGRRAGMAFASVVISLAIAAAREDHSDTDGNTEVGHVVVEAIATETLGSFRNIARLLFLMMTVADDESQPR
jgi:hypothetical protein